MADSNQVPSDLLTTLNSTEAPNPEQPEAWLVIKYCANGGLSVDTVKSALYDEQVNGALAEAKTLGELWRLLPQQERHTLADFFFEALANARRDSVDNEDLLPSDWQDVVCEDCGSDSYWAQDVTPFSPNEIPGFCDGDYPRWQQQSLDDVLPEDLLERFASVQHSVHNGPYWFIPHDSAPALVDALRRRGYHVEEATFLRGW